MQIVIDIPKEIYELCVTDDYFFYNETDTIKQAIKNGIPIPKKHGRLVDADALIELYEGYCGYGDIIDGLKGAPTIIEADVTDINVGNIESEE